MVYYYYCYYYYYYYFPLNEIFMIVKRTWEGSPKKP